jgi:hypothetical protein
MPFRQSVENGGQAADTYTVARTLSTHSTRFRRQHSAIPGVLPDLDGQVDECEEDRDARDQCPDRPERVPVHAPYTILK